MTGEQTTKLERQSFALGTAIGFVLSVVAYAAVLAARDVLGFMCARGLL